MNLAKYSLLFFVAAMGTQTLTGCMVMMPFMMAPAAFKASAQSSDQEHGKLIQEGLRELDANRGGYRLIYLRRIETDGHAFSNYKLRQVIYEQTASFTFRLLDYPAIEVEERIAILDVGLFRVDSVDYFNLSFISDFRAMRFWVASRSINPLKS